MNIFEKTLKFNLKYRKVLFVAICVLFTAGLSFLITKAGDLNPSAPPGSTMHTLDEIYTLINSKELTPISCTCGSNDCMVLVGNFCIDKYETSVWSSSSGGTQYGASSDNYPCSDNGNDCSSAAANPIYARSISGVTPSRYITWFQAAQACANVGKHICTDSQWQVAAAGTPDPGATGTPPNCNISGSAPTTTGGGTSCLSNWGTENMIGSLWEWVADWYGRGTNTTANSATYGSDYQYYTYPTANQGSGANMNAAALRGGTWYSGSGAGVFAVFLNDAPSSSGSRRWLSLLPLRGLSLI